MPASSTPPEQSPDLLRSACEQCVALLKVLLGIHLDIDPPTSVIAPNAPECVYRLQKVLLHVNAISSWQLDTHVMHVIAPELRAAQEQIDGFWDEAMRAMELEDGDGPVGRKTRQARAHAKTRKELVSGYVHPTPRRLFLPTEHGGLAPANDSRYYSNMVVVLADFVFRYSVSLAYMSQQLRAGKEQAIVSVMDEIGNAFATVGFGDSSTMS